LLLICLSWLLRGRGASSRLGGLGSDGGRRGLFALVVLPGRVEVAEEVGLDAVEPFAVVPFHDEGVYGHQLRGPHRLTRIGAYSSPPR
jgi:hypothetical protein